MPKPVDLKHWNKMPTAFLWECCYLACGSDPLEADSDTVYYTNHTSFKAIAGLWKISESHLALHKFKTIGSYADERYATVLLPEYLEWAKGIGYTVPGLTGYVEPASPTPVPAPLVEVKTVQKIVVVPLEVPERLTVRWLIDNGDYKFWGIVASIFLFVIAAAFASGRWVERIEQAAQSKDLKTNAPTTPAAAETTTTPPKISNDKKAEPIAPKEIPKAANAAP